MGLGCFAWRTLTQEQAFRATDLSQNRSLLNLDGSITRENEKLDKLTSSVEGITASVAQSTSRMDEFSDQVGAGRREVDGWLARLIRVEGNLRDRQHGRPQATAMVTPMPIPPLRGVLGEASMSNPHTHQVDTAIPLPGGSLGHRNLQGELDYWMVPRMLPSGERFFKVQPYGTTSLGVQVHSIDDGMDYILTPRGGWMEALGER
jgi:hypothetical protein